MGTNEERLAESFAWTPLAVEVGLEHVGNLEPPLTEVEASVIGGLLRGDQVDCNSQDPMVTQEIELRYGIVTARDRQRNGYEYDDRTLLLSGLITALRESQDVIAKQVAMDNQAPSSTAVA